MDGKTTTGGMPIGNRDRGSQTPRWRETDSNFWYRGTKAVDFRSIRASQGIGGAHLLPFEKARLGVAPFRHAGYYESTFQAAPGEPIRAGGPAIIAAMSAGP
jgi:hypothetical protein